MAGLAQRFVAFLQEAERRPFEWGTFDCSLFPADWVLLARGVDPAADLRGRYETPLGAARLIQPLGGLLGVWDRNAAAAGLARASEGRLGDIGIVMAPDENGRLTPAGAVCAGKRWICKSPDGLTSVVGEPLAAWRV